jgi:hypothetical protein
MLIFAAVEDVFGYESDGVVNGEDIYAVARDIKSRLLERDNVKDRRVFLRITVNDGSDAGEEARFLLIP